MTIAHIIHSYTSHSCGIMENELINVLANEIIEKLNGKIFNIEKDIEEFLQAQISKKNKEKVLEQLYLFQLNPLLTHRSEQLIVNKGTDPISITLKEFFENPLFDEVFLE